MRNIRKHKRPSLAGNKNAVGNSGGKPARSGPLGNKNALRHGHFSINRALKERGLKALDGRSALGRALSEWKRSLIADLGGEDGISTQQRAIVDLAVKSKLLLDSIDAWILRQPSVINLRKKSLLPVVKERSTLANNLAQYLGMLGLKRRPKDVPSLENVLDDLRREDHGDDGKSDNEAN